MSEKFKTVLREFTQTLEDVGIDEAFLDISPMDNPSEKIAKEIHASEDPGRIYRFGTRN